MSTVQNINIITRFVVQVKNCLEECETCSPVANNSKQTLIEVCHQCRPSKHPAAKDLLSIFTKLHFKVHYDRLRDNDFLKQTGFNRFELESTGTVGGTR